MYVPVYYVVHFTHVPDVAHSHLTNCTYAGIDHCNITERNCSHYCVDDFGVYRCLCKDGYRLGSDEHMCQGMYMYVCVCMYSECVHAYVHMHCTYIHTYVHMYVYTYIPRFRGSRAKLNPITRVYLQQEPTWLLIAVIPQPILGKG